MDAIPVENIPNFGEPTIPHCHKIAEGMNNGEIRVEGALVRATIDEKQRKCYELTVGKPFGKPIQKTASIGATVISPDPRAETFRYGNRFEIARSIISYMEKQYGIAFSDTLRNEIFRSIDGREVHSIQDLDTVLTDIVRVISRLGTPEGNRVTGAIREIRANPGGFLRLLGTKYEDSILVFLERIAGLVGSHGDDASIVALISNIQGLSGANTGSQFFSIDQVIALLPPDIRTQFADLTGKTPSFHTIEEISFRLVSALERVTGGKIAFVSIAGERYADGAMLIRLPSGTIALISKKEAITGKTVEEVLDLKSINSGKLVSVHYLVDARGNIIGEIRTPLTKFLEGHLYFSASDREKWLQDPSSIPEGLSIEVKIYNTERSVILTNKTKGNFYTILEIKEGTLFGVQASSIKMTLAGTYDIKGNQLTIYAGTGKVLVGRNGNNSNTIDSVYAGAMAQGDIYGGVTSQLGWAASVKAQAEAQNGVLSRPNTGELGYKIGVNGGSAVTKDTNIGGYFQVVGNSGVSVTPHIHLNGELYRKPFSDRNPLHFNTEVQVGLTLTDKQKSGETIKVGVHGTSSNIVQKISGNISHTLKGTTYTIHGESQKSIHPLGPTSYKEIGAQVNGSYEKVNWSLEISGIKEPYRTYSQGSLQISTPFR